MEFDQRCENQQPDLVKIKISEGANHSNTTEAKADKEQVSGPVSQYCRRLLVVRNDRLGDFMLSWPALALLRNSLPNTEITVLAPSYTEPLARICPWVDGVILDPGAQAPAASQRKLLEELREKCFDAMLTLFSTFRTGWLGMRAGIPLRMAPATKFAQILYPIRITQRRSRSLKPEFVYNQELAIELLNRLKTNSCSVSPPFWPLSQQERRAIRVELAEQLKLPSTKPWFFLHAGSGGSANNLSLTQYAKVASETNRLLARESKTDQALPVWVLTAGPGEIAKAQKLAERCQLFNVNTVIYHSQEGLAKFARSLAAADLFISGSTGPLHIAGCLDVPTVGFFPAKRSSTALRWRPCNSSGRTLGIQPPEDANKTDMSLIKPIKTAENIIAFWRQMPISQPPRKKT